VLLLISVLALGALGFLFFTIYRESRTTGRQAAGGQAATSGGTLCDWLSPPASIPGSPATATFGLLVTRQSAGAPPAPVPQYKVKIVLSPDPSDAGRLVSVNDAAGPVALGADQPVSSYEAKTDADGLIAATVTLQASCSATLQAMDLENGEAGAPISFTAE
jgi:hypothetical protein